MKSSVSKECPFQRRKSILVDGANISERNFFLKLKTTFYPVNRENISPVYCYLFTKLHGVMSQTAVTFTATAVKTFDFVIAFN